MRPGIRAVPWLLAAAGLGIPWLANGFAGWPYVLGWAIVLFVFWAVTRLRPASRRERIAVPLVLIPVLFVLGIVGGWYLIPADVAWLLIELSDRRDNRVLPARRTISSTHAPP